MKLATVESWVEPATSAMQKKIDRKSTRLNSSHSQISYAVFCLKKKNHVVSHRATYHLDIFSNCVDQKSTLLKSRQRPISYAVFCMEHKQRKGHEYAVNGTMVWA